jgi:flavin-dependent dehydrogenase
MITTPEYSAVANYAYHLDAGAFSRFLTRHAVENLGVRHVLDEVTGVVSAENGDLSAVSTRSHGNLEGDLFIDCTGFRSLLLGQHFGVPFESCSDVLFVDTALAVQVPYADEDAPIASHTVATAQEAGWIWDISLASRKGIGHVYSSAHITEERAISQLHEYLRPLTDDVDALDIRRIPINPGHRTRFWERNCVAIGLSAGFLEPLEASALLLIEISANMIADQFPANREVMDIVSRRYNEATHYRWDRIIDFLKLHYAITSRTDSDFWVDNQKDETIPDSLRELLTLWRYQCPWHEDFDRAIEVFPAASYQYVLYGMGFRTEPSPLGISAGRRAEAERFFRQNRRKAEQMMDALPTNRELLGKINQYGMQRV